MASNLSDISAVNLLNWYLKNSASTNQATTGSLWVGLCTAAPDDATTNEVSGKAEYARQQINFGTVAAGTVASATGPTTAATFPQATQSWGTISGYVVCAASTGSTGTDQYLFYGAVSPTVAVTANDTVSFATGALTLSFD